MRKNHREGNNSSTCQRVKTHLDNYIKKNHINYRTDIFSKLKLGLEKNGISVKMKV
jgi:hypothetical protein